ncbi:MAG TPA: phosphate signaling complex protein PhoU [Polyangiaceae bacterium]|jgi:phosphate transport system protein
MNRTHTDREYDNQLSELRQRLLLMASRVEEMISNSVKALVERDVELAKRTIEADHKVNRAEVETDELCLVILAKRQPMASDLRFITLALKMVTDLERIGDLAVNICERAIDLAGTAELKPWQDVPQMATIVQSMVGDAIDAFVASDAEKARKVIERDQEVDQLYIRVFREVLTIMRNDASAVERGIHVQSVAKWLERMADHATNLAEQVIFMVKGKDVRHMGSLAAS